MKRKSQTLNPAPVRYSPNKTNTELAPKIGQLVFAWNFIENVLDWAFDAAIEVEPLLRVEVRSRINGLEGKVGVVKAAIQTAGKFSVAEQRLLLECFGRFMHYKKLRDAVIHVRIGGLNKEGIAPTFEQQGKTFEALISKDAIEALNQHLFAYQDEIQQAQGVIFLRRLARPTPTPREPKPPQHRELEIMLQDLLSALRKMQAQRKSLPSLLEFPQEHWLKEAARQSPKRPAGE